jgi:hypothetical protein
MFASRLFDIVDRASRPASTLPWPAHQLQSRLDVPPIPGRFGVAFVLECLGFLRSFDDSLRAARFEQLTGIILDFCFQHFAPHVAYVLRQPNTEKANIFAKNTAIER